MPLHSCSACARHRRASDARCPFCGTVEAPADAPRSIGRASRAAIAFGGIVLAGAAAGCFTVAGAYGAPPPPPPSNATTTTVTTSDAGAPADASP